MIAEVIIMCPIINNNEPPRRPVGRPQEGAEKRSIERKIRLEPYLDEHLEIACRYLGITRAEGIRQGIRLFIKEAESQIFGGGSQI